MKTDYNIHILGLAKFIKVQAQGKKSSSQGSAKTYFSPQLQFHLQCFKIYHNRVCSSSLKNWFVHFTHSLVYLYSVYGATGTTIL